MDLTDGMDIGAHEEVETFQDLEDGEQLHGSPRSAYEVESSEDSDDGSVNEGPRKIIAIDQTNSLKSRGEV